MSKVAFHYYDKPQAEPVVFETILGELNGGGMVANCDYDLKKGLAMGLKDGMYAPIKAAIVAVDAESGATSVSVEKGSGIKSGEFLAFGKKSVEVTGVDNSDPKFDVLTITLGVALKAGNVLYQAKSASASSAAPALTPVYLLGENIPANSGDVLTKLVNIANVRKETAPVADEVVALMKGIHKI